MTAPIGKQRVVTPQPQTLVSSPWTALGRGPCLDTHWREKGKCTEVGETLFPALALSMRPESPRVGLGGSLKQIQVLWSEEGTADGKTKQENKAFASHYTIRQRRKQTRKSARPTQGLQRAAELASGPRPLPALGSFQEQWASVSRSSQAEVPHSSLSALPGGLDTPSPLRPIGRLAPVLFSSA